MPSQTAWWSQPIIQSRLVARVQVSQPAPSPVSRCYVTPVTVKADYIHTHLPRLQMPPACQEGSTVEYFRNMEVMMKTGPGLRCRQETSDAARRCVSPVTFIRWDGSRAGWRWRKELGASVGSSVIDWLICGLIAWMVNSWGNWIIDSWSNWLCIYLWSDFFLLFLCHHGVMGVNLYYMLFT